MYLTALTLIDMIKFRLNVSNIFVPSAFVLLLLLDLLHRLFVLPLAVSIVPVLVVAQSPPLRSCCSRIIEALPPVDSECFPLLNCAFCDSPRISFSICNSTDTASRCIWLVVRSHKRWCPRIGLTVRSSRLIGEYSLSGAFGNPVSEPE